MINARTLALIGLAALVVVGVLIFWRSPDQPSGTSTSSYAAFASKATKGSDQLSALIGGDILIGGLTAEKLHLANGLNFPVQQSNGLTSFTITLPHNSLLQATGKPLKGTTYSGSFSITQDGKPLTSGIWSATPVQDPQTQIGYEFLDDAAGADYSGAMLLGTTHGMLYLPNGTTIVANSQRTGPANSLSSPITLTLSLLGGNTLACIGTPLRNTAMQGISGVFVDPVSHHSRVCNALVFS